MSDRFTDFFTRAIIETRKAAKGSCQKKNTGVADTLKHMVLDVLRGTMRNEMRWGTLSLWFTLYSKTGIGKLKLCRKKEKGHKSLRRGTNLSDLNATKKFL